MFCPKCKSEYRSGITHCPDCDIDLEQLLQESLHSHKGLRRVWSGDTASDCVELCQDLKEAGIEYEVVQVPTGPGPNMGSNWRFEIKVPDSDFSEAQQLLTENPDEIVEVPSDPRLTVQDDTDKRKYLRKPGPKDTLVEIHTQGSKDNSSMVELSLDTNLIRFKKEVQDDGSVKLFVRTEDESRAREILREIREGKPPE